jgi:dienelactone hydrolase
MAEVLLFHHVLGLTPGVQAFADRLRDAGHRVTTPDLFEGATFASIDEGLAHARSVGFDTLQARGVAAAEGMPDGMVYAGFSMGAGPAQQLAQTRPGALGAILYHGAIPAEEFGPWPDGVALQIHLMEHDPFDDLPVARELVAGVSGAELFVYPGDGHLFTDSSSPEFDTAATDLVIERTLAMLRRLSQPTAR